MRREREGPGTEEKKRAKSRGNQFVLHQKTWPIGKQKPGGHGDAERSGVKHNARAHTRVGVKKARGIKRKGT